MMPEITNRHSKPTCRVVWAGTEFTGKQALLYAPGISAESVGAQRIHLQIVTIPPGGRAKAHKHEAHETAIHVLSGLSGMWYGEKLEAERTEPGIEQSCRGIAIFIGTRSIGLIPCPATLRSASASQKCPKVRHRFAGLDLAYASRLPDSSTCAAILNIRTIPCYRS
jgi:hypothetical protein